MRLDPFSFLPLGQGELDFRDILRAIQEAGYDSWLLVELDSYDGDPAEAARISKSYLDGLLAELDLSVRTPAAAGSPSPGAPHDRPRLLIRAAALPVALALALTGCSAASDTATSAPDADNADVAKATAALEELEGKVLSKGPERRGAGLGGRGRADPEQVEQVKAMKATAAIVMHYGGNDWSTAQIDGAAQRVRAAGHRGRRRHRRELQAGQAGLGHRDRHGARSRTSSSRIPTDPVATASAYKAVARGRREARLHGQRRRRA